MSDAVSDAAQRSSKIRRTRALVNLLAPSSLAVLRVLRVEADLSGARPLGEPPYALLSGGWVYPVVNSVVSLGRGLRNDVTLLDPAASREHARLLREPDGWWIENLSGANPLWVEAETVAPGTRALVAPGAAFQLGNTVLQLLAPDTSPDIGPDPGEEPGEERSAPLNGAHQASLTGEMTALGLTGTHLLSPGVTLQYALRGKLGPRPLLALLAALLLLFAVCAVLTLGITTLVGRDALALGGAGRVLAALTIPLIPALGAAVVVWALDRYEREPPLLLLAAFLWGAVIAIPPALYIERALTAALGETTVVTLGNALTQALTAGVTEELIKGAGLLILLLLLRDEFDNVTDGVIYGVLIGAGFALVENYVYFSLSSHTDFGFLIVGRVLLGWLGHSTFTAAFGAGLGYAREAHGARGRRYRILAPLIGLLVALFLHTLFDFVAFAADAANRSTALGERGPWIGVISALLDYLPLFAAQLILLIIVIRSLRREAAIIRAYLADETLSSVVTPDEYILAQDARLRTAAERQYVITYGARPWLTARALYQTEIGLAFRKWHVAQGDPPKRGSRQPEDAYRARIVRLRRSLLRQISPLAMGSSVGVLSGEPSAGSQPASP